jgi:hypothetical protein
MLGNVHNSIRQGDTFAGPLRASKTVDLLVSNMVAVGEETGDLDKMLLKVADQYDEQVDVLVVGLMSMLEPLIILVLGSTVMPHRAVGVLAHDSGDYQPRCRLIEKSRIIEDPRVCLWKGEDHATDRDPSQKAQRFHHRGAADRDEHHRDPHRADGARAQQGQTLRPGRATKGPVQCHQRGRRAFQQ